MCRMAFAWSSRWLACLSLLLGGRLPATAAEERLVPQPPLPLATNLLQLHRLVAQQRRFVCAFRLEGVVCAANPSGGWLALQDDSGAELLELGLPLQGVSAGQRVRLEADRCAATLGPVGLAINRAPLVDNDGIHSLAKRSGTVYLQAGRHPIRLTWFNALAKLGLEVAYAGPGLAIQMIPGSALFREQADPANGRTNLVNGLDYRDYEGDWGNSLPDFNQLTPVKTGTATNFDLGVRTRDEHVGLEFSGYLAVPANGFYSFEVASDDGSQLFLGPHQVRLEPLGWVAVPAPGQIIIGQSLRVEAERQWAVVEGLVTFASEQNGHVLLELSSGAERMRVVVADGSGLSPGCLLHTRIRARGVCQSIYATDARRIAGDLSVLSGKELSSSDTPSGGQSDFPIVAVTNMIEAPAPTRLMPLLTTVEEVKRLKREEAQRGHSVRLRGVITQAVLGNTAVVIQDATRGIFVSGLPPNGSGAPRIGEYWEIEGVTGPGDFAPVVLARRATRLGEGRLPEPARPTWDQLMNGSLDTQYVELQGIVTAIQGNRLELLLREGKLQLTVPALNPAALNCFVDTLVRVRGCLFPAWDKATHRVRIGEMTMANASVNVDEPAPTDPFSLPSKHPAELLLFDLGAGALQRVKVAGQILGVRAGQYFMMDGTNGLRLLAKEGVELQAGDLVEAVGFPELVGPSPMLREAVALKTGHTALPKPRKLRPEHLLNESYDATLVRVQGVLTHWHNGPAGPVLEMQFGLRTALARLPAGADFLQPPAIGSVLELTGVYAGLGGNRALGRGLDSFELMLNSPSDIRVLAQPPWWTMPRLLAAFAAVAVVLFGAMLWGLSLRRQVRAQTAIIRQKAQREAALEERARIAKDIHDDVGSSLTFIMMLGERSRQDIARPRDLAIHTDKIVAYARATVQSLDEIVWAVNPQNDTFDALVGYLNQYTSQIFESTSVRCRLEVPETLSNLILPAEVRHDLFLVVKEALNNVLKHAQASEVAVRITEAAGVLEIAVEDNGRGFVSGQPINGRRGNGLDNMHRRMAKIGGVFCLTTAPGQGTKLIVTVNLAAGPQPVVKVP